MAADLALAGDWSLRDAAGVEIGPCPIPGDVHSALVAAGRIPDPTIGMNEAKVQSVGDAACCPPCRGVSARLAPPAPKNRALSI